MAATKKVDINTAKLEDFESLIGVGHAKAESIIEHRKVNGPYSSVADLKQILGIGPSILEQNKDLLTCSTPPSTSGKSSAQKGHGTSERETRRSARTEGLTPASQSASSSSYGSSLSYSSSSNGHSSSSGGSSGGSSPPADDASTLSAARVRAASLRHRTSASAGASSTSSAPRTRGAERRMLRGQVAVVVGDEDDHDADWEEEAAETETHSPKGGGDRGERTRNTSNSSGETERGGANKDANSSKIRNDEELGKSDNNDNTAVNDAGADIMECSYGDTPGNVSEGVLASLRSRTSSAAATAAASASEKALMKRKCEGGGANKDMSPGKKPCRLSTEDAASVASPIPSECSNSSGGPCSHDPCQHCLHCSQCGQSTTPPPPSHPSMAQMRKRIPSKTNPHPDLANWLKTYQEWSHAERLLALNELIELCEVTEVRHMMAVIEPQFQRDFISLLPKELALKVLTYLEPRDLCRAAQTCRYWRILASDNLLWREKCKEEAISEATVYENSVRKRNPCSKNPWKGLYLRQKDIEHRWRGAPIKDPKVLKGHDDHVITCLEFCGSRIVSGSDDNTLKVWSAVTGKCLRTLVGHTGGVWSSQMAGHVVISGSTDRTLRVWHADTGQCMHTLYGHTSTVRCMCLHNNKVVSGSRDATLRMWDIETGECLHVLMGHIAAVRCVQYDGKRVVSGAYDYMVKIWDPETETCLHTLQGHTNRVYSLQFDGTHIVSGSLDTSIRVWDVETGQSLHTLIGHQSLTSGMELKDSILVSGNADSTVKVWDIRTGHCLQTLQGPHKHQSAVTCLQFNRRFAVTSSDDGTVKLWSVRTGEFVRDLVRLESGGSGGVVWRLRCSNTKLVCAVGSRNGTEETKLLVLDFDVDDSLPAGDRSKSDSSTPASGSGESSGRRSSVS